MIAEIDRDNVLTGLPVCIVINSIKLWWAMSIFLISSAKELVKKTLISAYAGPRPASRSETGSHLLCRT
jgi:hypothetical protein